MDPRDFYLQSLGSAPSHSQPPFDTDYLDHPQMYSDQAPRTDLDSARTTRPAYSIALPGGGFAYAVPLPAPQPLPVAPPAFVPAGFGSMSYLPYASVGPPLGASFAMPSPVTWQSGYYEPTVGPVYAAGYPHAVASSPLPPARAHPTTRGAMISRGSSGENASYLSATSISRGSTVPPAPPPGFRLPRKSVHRAPRPKSRGPRSDRGGDDYRSARSDRGGDDYRSARRAAGGARSSGAGDEDETSYISRAKQSGVSEWHMITAGGDDDGPPQPRDPLGPRRYSKYYQ